MLGTKNRHYALGDILGMAEMPKYSPNKKMTGQRRSYIYSPV